MYGELVPVGGGDPIPLLKKSLLVGRRESCDIVLRFSNVSAHHCQLTVNARLLVRPRPAEPQRREGQRGAGDRQAARSGRHPLDRQAQVRGAATRRSTWARSGRRRPTCPKPTSSASRCWSGRGWSSGSSPGRKTLGRPGRIGVATTSRRTSRASSVSAEQAAVGWPRRRKSAPTSARTATSAPDRPTGRGEYREHGFEDEAPLQSERISGKGELVRRRTVCGEQLDGEAEPGFGVQLDVDESVCRRGRVLSVLGLISMVEDEAGRVYQCATRRLLKTLATDQRHVVAAGDRVVFRPVENSRAQGRRDRAGRAAARLHLPGGSRAAAGPGGQCRSIGHRRQRGRAAAEAEPDRPPAGRRRKGRRPAADLHQQDRSGRPGRPAAAGGRLQPDGLRGAAAQREDRLRHRAVPPRDGAAAPTSWPGKAAWASRRC